MPALLVANIALACGPWLVRLAGSESHVGPVASAFWRLALALPVLVLATRLSDEPTAKQAGSLAWLTALGGIFFAADLAAWHFGILHTRLANATLLGNVTAILFPAYGFLAARRWPSRRQAFALVLAGLGGLMLLGRSYELSARNILGDLVCIVAGLFYTGYLIAIDRARRRIGPIQTLTLAVIAGAPFLLPGARLLGEPIWPTAWWPLVLLMLGSQLIGQGLILVAVSRVSPLVMGLMLLVQPIVASAIGWLIFGEQLTGADVVGGVLIGVAVLLVRDAVRSEGVEEKVRV